MQKSVIRQGSAYKICKRHERGNSAATVIVFDKRWACVHNIICNQNSSGVIETRYYSIQCLVGLHEGQSWTWIKPHANALLHCKQRQNSMNIARKKNKRNEILRILIQANIGLRFVSVFLWVCTWTWKHTARTFIRLLKHRLRLRRTSFFHCNRSPAFTWYLNFRTVRCVCTSCTIIQKCIQSCISFT